MDAEKIHSGCDGAVLVTPSADHCLPEITRDTILLLAKELGLNTEVRRVSLGNRVATEDVQRSCSNKLGWSTEIPAFS